MKNKVTKFPQPSPGPTDVNVDEPLIFSLGDQRFAVQYTVVEVKCKPAEVIPFSEIRQRKGGKCKRVHRK